MPRANCRARRSGVLMTVFTHRAWTYDHRLKSHMFNPREVARTVTAREAVSMIFRGVAVLEFGQSAAARGQRVDMKLVRREGLEPIGITLREPKRENKPIKVSPAMLTFGETLANAGAHDNHNFCVQTEIKVLEWPLIDFGRMKTTTVRPPMSGEEFDEAAASVGLSKEDVKLARRIYVDRELVTA